MCIRDRLEALAKLAKEAQLTEKFEALYNGAVINTGENRLVLHQLTRGPVSYTHLDVYKRQILVHDRVDNSSN